MTRRIATTAATMAALLLLPASALANVDNVSVTGGVLTYTSGAGTRDSISVFDWGVGTHRLTDWVSPAWSPGADCAYVGFATSECTGATSLSLTTLDGDDRVDNDASLPATVVTGDGADEILGGPLPDTIDAGPGDDTIDVRAGGVDTVDCGDGIETLQADAEDVLTNCVEPPPVEPAAVPDVPVEAPPVEAPAPVQVQVPGEPGSLPAFTLLPVTIDQKVVKVGSDGIATFDISCAAFEAGGCVGTLYLDPLPRAREGAPRAVAARRGRYGRGKFTAAAGAKARVRVSLSRSARRRLGLSSGRRARAARRGRRVKGQVTVSQRGKKPVKSKVTLKS